MERVAAEVIGESASKYAFAHADNLSFYLSMRNVYLQRFVGEMKEKEQTFQFAVLSSKTQKYNQIAKLASQTVYLYPRLHSAFPLLLQDVYL